MARLPASPFHVPTPQATNGTALVAPYGGVLPDLLLREPERVADVRARAVGAKRLVLSERLLGDLELLTTGAYAPLTAFLGRADTESVLDGLRLENGTLWPVPITLPVPDDVAEGDLLALCDAEREVLALLTVEETFSVDPVREARALFGPHAEEHPLRGELRARGPHRAHGALEVVRRPDAGLFARWLRTPVQARAALAELGAPRVVAIHTRNPMHRAQEWIARTAQAETDATLLVHSTTGPSLPDDVEPLARMRAIDALVRERFDPTRTLLATLPLPMWMAGPRDALLHAIVRRNHGASHFVVGRDHAGPGRTRSGAPFFSPTAAQEAVVAHAKELGVTPVPFGEVVYLADEDRYERAERAPAAARVRRVSGAEVRGQLERGGALAAWALRREAGDALARS